MSKRSQEKRRARSKEKKLARRRMMGNSPISRLAGEEACQCWLTYQEGDNRMQSIQVYRPVRGGGSMVAGFLVDFDCLGLKDAFIRLNVDYHKLRERMRIQSEDSGVRFLLISLDAARKLVSEAITWTRQHAYFSVPDDTERSLRVLGGLGENPSTDTQAFGHNGGLLYVGRTRDLERRLVGMTVEEFMNLEGVDVVCAVGEETLIDEESIEEWDEDDPERPLTEADLQEIEKSDDLFRSMQQVIKQKLLEGVRHWCAARGRAPHAALERTIDLMSTSSAEALGAVEDDEAAERARENEESLLSLEDAQSREEMDEANAQLAGFLRSFAHPDKFCKALGLSEEAATALLEQASE